MPPRTRAAEANPRYRMVEADLLKELAVAFSVVTALVLLAAVLFSSPDQPTFTAQQLASRDPLALERTALHILDGQNAIASYGPPYNHGTGSVQSLGFFSPQTWFGVTLPVDAPKVFFLDPLERVRLLDPQLSRLLTTFTHASPAARARWEAAFGHALDRAEVKAGRVFLPHVDAGPLPGLMDAYVALARSGALEAIINASGRVYQTDFTRALLLLQGSPLQAKAAGEHLLGSEWGMMKEPGNYPGAVWLWFYTLLYQIPPYNTSSAGDLLVGLTVGIVTLILMFLPWVPGLRDIPRAVRVYRLIWRSYYAETERRPR